MEDLELFKNRIDSYIDKAYSGGVAVLPFLDEAKIAIINNKIKSSGVNAYFDGGIINSDRKRAILSMYDVENNDFKIEVFKIDYNKKFYEINHRAILGSLMSLGIKRECIGDIVIDDDLNAYVAVTKEISSYLLDHFNSVGKATINLIKIDYEVINNIKYEDKLHFLSSLRLDVFVAAAAKASRSEALEMIASSLIFLNALEIKNPSHVLKCDDIISIRHKGKFKLSNIGNESKSGRLAVTISKRI